MGKFLDLTGEVFTRLTVIERAEDYVSPKGQHMVCWNCRCECGNKITATSNTLTTGRTKSCGCYIKEIGRHKDLTGRRFGSLVVLYMETKRKISQNTLVYWRCLCDCGNYTITSSKSLVNDGTKSCVECGHKRTANSNFINLQGVRFGKLTVSGLYSKSKSNTTKWLCQCDCGNRTVVITASLQNGTTTSCGCLLESKIASVLKAYFLDNRQAITEYKILKNPKTNRYLPYDIYIPSDNAYIEINGIQHYSFLDYWHKTLENFKYQCEKDNLKKIFARESGVYIEVDLRKNKTADEWVDYIESFILKTK